MSKKRKAIHREVTEESKRIWFDDGTMDVVLPCGMSATFISVKRNEYQKYQFQQHLAQLV